MEANEIPTGAYVIRASQTSTVLGIRETSLLNWSWIVMPEQDENNRRDQQIWWIEPLPTDEDDVEGVTYTITSITSGRVLGIRVDDGTKSTHDGGTWVTGCPADGTLCQGWKIRGGQDGEGKTYYTLANADNDDLLDISATGSTDPTELPWGFCQKYISERKEQRWELVVPKVVFPCGWFQIQNSETGALLSHTYLSNPPVLVDPRSTTLSTQYRESWDTQWTLIHAKSLDPDFPCDTTKNMWCIRNRLTKAFLGNTACTVRGAPGLAVTGMESNLFPVGGGKTFKKGIDIAEYTWELELDLDRHWKIINRNTSCLLEASQVASRRGKTGVVCASKKVASNNSWILTSPVVGALNEL